MEEVELILKKGKIKPNIFLDQHFMTDVDIIKRIIETANINKNDIVLEIGAGIGTLTKRISKRANTVVAVEMDKKFKPILNRCLRECENVKLIFDNVLKIINDIKFNKIISNTPYSISEPLIQKMIRLDFELAVLSLPKKFANMLTSNYKSNHSYLSFTVKNFFRMETIFDIPKNAFFPVPKIKSCVMKIKKLETKDYKIDKAKYIMKEILLQPKKKLKNALMEAIINLHKEIIEEPFTKRMSKEVVKSLELKKNLLEKMVKEVSLSELLSVRKSILSL